MKDGLSFSFFSSSPFWAEGRFLGEPVALLIYGAAGSGARSGELGVEGEISDGSTLKSLVFAVWFFGGRIHPAKKEDRMFIEMKVNRHKQLVDTMGSFSDERYQKCVGKLRVGDKCKHVSVSRRRCSF